MAILVDEDTVVLVQGITGNEGSRAAREMMDYGTRVVCGVTPGKGGQEAEGIPVYDTVKKALEHHPEVNTSVVYVPPLLAKDAVMEAVANGIGLIVVVTETIPVHDTAEMMEYARKKGSRIVGPSSIGIISPGKAKLGSIGGDSNIQFIPGRIGLISKSGGMSSETAMLLKEAGYGTSTVIGIGGDIISGTDFIDCLELFENDPETDAVVMFCEIGGAYEEKAAEYIKDHVKKQVVAFVSGKFADLFQQVSLGHAGAIVEGDKGTREAKVNAFRDAGVAVADVHHEIVELLDRALGKNMKK